MRFPAHLPSRTPWFATILSAAALLASVLIAGSPAAADDIDLLRFDTAKPLVFVLLSTGTSMSRDFNGELVEAGSDDPRSKLYQAKEVIYDVFGRYDNLHLGLATYPNQDQLRVRKHWLYFVADTAGNRDAVAALGLDYPRVEPEDRLEVPIFDADGEPIGVTLEIDGDLMTFGVAFDEPAGTCAAPLDLDRDRAAVNRYARLGADSFQTTRLWVEGGSPKKTYRLTFTNPTGSDKLGKDQLAVRLRVERLIGGSGACDAPVFTNSRSEVLQLRLYRDFLVPEGDLWGPADTTATYACGESKPFSGGGWEGNYDTGAVVPADPELDPVPWAPVAAVDTFCNADGECWNLRSPTTRDAELDKRELDVGDLLPMHWQQDHRQAFLSRLNLEHATAGRGFGVAGYFVDEPDADGYHRLVDPARQPLVAAGPSPLSKTILDFRCWYASIGDQPGNKCKNKSLPYVDGFEALAESRDLEWECRRPYLILVTDGDNNCPASGPGGGEDPSADIANLFSHHFIRTWAVVIGDTPPGVEGWVRPGQGEVVTATDRTALESELDRILGVIDQQTRTFASAAVPSVQADVDDKIFLTQFTPLRSSGYWDGEVHAFLKPLPVKAGTGTPDVDHPERHLWDAGQVLLEQAPELADVPLPATRATLEIGAGISRRRVYTAMLPQGDAVPRWRQLVAPVEPPLALPPGYDANDLREDLWMGLGVAAADFELGDTDVAAEFFDIPEAVRAHTVLRKTYVEKHDVIDQDGVPISVDRVLGDVFHSDPLVVGGPINVRFFLDDLHGYRAFTELQKRRRKVLIVGANDGMLHAFDAGVFHGGVEDGAFDNGSGREIFAYAPRATLPTLTRLAEGTQHQWGVDGSPVAADVWIDPAHDGTPVAAERQWRTVVIAGLRRGGASYVALDITEPDAMEADVDPRTGSLLGYVPAPGISELPGRPNVYPLPLWEFTDPRDEDANGAPDLGQTWSTPNLGVVRVLDGGEVVDRFVAVFGGGLDPDGRVTGGSGNWLYMVDMETGRVLYKRQLMGAAPAEPAAVDTDQDGYLDRIYLGTTAGYLYRADVDEPQPLEDFGGERRVLASAWDPEVIFDTVTYGVDDEEIRRPIYLAPSVIFIARRGLYALAFGTGDREDLWTVASTAGERLYVFVDTSEDLAAPLTELDLVPLGLGDVDDDYLTTPGSRGWFLELEDAGHERLVTTPKAISGVLTFATFLPDVEAEDDPDIGGGLKLCQKRGSSRSYVVFADSGNAVRSDELGQPQRYESLARSFVTEPYVEQAQSRGVDDGTGMALTPELRDIMEALKRLFPERCRFSDSFRLDIKTMRSDTGVVFVAPVPVCMVRENWKEY